MHATVSTEVLPLLGRSGAPAPPVRIVHLGLGAFHRSHQAWFTAHAPDAAEWGIASFTGRRPDAARVLAAQDGLFTLIERGGDGDRFEVVGSIAEAIDGADTARLDALLAAPSTAIVTLTVTEAVYEKHDADSPLARLCHGLSARRQAGAGPIAVVSCDNVAGNAEVAQKALLAIAEGLDSGLASWMRENVSFVGTSVDRITPRTTPDDVALVASECGYRDEAPVVAEPFANWILAGDFPAGRPRWEDAGAQFVADIEPFENRKLWLLNGAHSILAYAGQLRGHTTVAEAIADPVCRDAVEAFWDAAARHLTLPELAVPQYRAALIERFSNPRIAHHLAQIAADGTTKLRMRAVPVLSAEIAGGRTGVAAARMIAVWMDFVSAAASGDFQDPLKDQVLEAASLEGRERTQALAELVSPAVAGDPVLVDRIHSLRGTLDRQ
ncbi:oxidoreductase [Sinomonas atrocyanea]|uniref:Mannitol-1-phosphate 5-dehydrogenase n=1 Tax=Sinomonas atrocyanea TaxID=37927 RepID=A0A126ZVD1_9MICC|nr:mannitol dehydrogenase family protein [Sinomonas atrocyanea]AMM31118.1 oxidoreductase [Sinomonas atrocyanea]GEB65866.1 mannitol-1-phosphate 5-dehydrogenase [Sinomonas atrocyanea]GGG54668.1 mannitol-1-phosphate 5-dehydrogenase [Sinomonas atrocyanea]